MTDRLFSKPGEQPYQDPDDWVFTIKRHAAHACGWTCTTPLDDSPGYRAAVIDHRMTCPWPDMPEPTETVSD